MVIPTTVRKKYRIKKGLKLLVDEDPLYGRIFITPIPVGVDPLAYFALKRKLPIAEPEEISGEEEAQRDASRREHK